MLDLSGPDVCPSTIAKVGEWSRQPCVREGFLTLFDAACLMAAKGYGGIFETCSKATQNEILGLNEALERSVDDRRALEGYLPVNRFVNGEYQDVYPLIAFKYWAERTGYGDGRYFAKAEGPGVDVAGGDEPEAAGGNMFQYRGSSAVTLDRNTPRYALCSKRKSMTVYEFACLYCGIDPKAVIPKSVRDDYIEPLIALMVEHMELDDGVPF